MNDRVPYGGPVPSSNRAKSTGVTDVIIGVLLAVIMILSLVVVSLLVDQAETDIGKERVVEVETTKTVEVEKPVIIEVEKPVITEKIVKVEVEKPVIIEKEKVIERIVEVGNFDTSPRSGSHLQDKHGNVGYVLTADSRYVYVEWENRDTNTKYTTKDFLWMMENGRFR